MTGLKRSPFGQTSLRFEKQHHVKKTPGKLVLHLFKENSFGGSIISICSYVLHFTLGVPKKVIGSFSSKIRTSLKTQLLFMFLERSNFPTFSLPESCSDTDKFPKNILRSRISIICEYAHITLCFPS